jgi:hypothetical protein
VRRSETWYCSICFWNKIQQDPCLLGFYWLGLEKGLGSVYLTNDSKLAYFSEESSMSMNSLAPETSHIMALKIKDYIISSLLLAHHYLRLIVDDHSYSGPGLSG